MTARRCVPALALLILVVLPTRALAGPLDDPSTDSFYRPPAPLPAAGHGTLLRSRPFSPQMVPGVPLPARGWQIMYTSRNVRGEPVAVTGTVMVPNGEWRSGPRPVIAWAVGTQGIADRCAPSHQYAVGTEYEAVILAQALARGWAIAMTDYEGLGTPGDHTYTVSRPEGHAVLDSVYAARQLTAAGVRPDALVGIMGYSQGGDSAAAAAELAAGYAASLNIKGTAAGGTFYYTPDLIRNADGSAIAGVVPAALIGLDAAFPELDLDSILTPRGRTVVADARESKCLAEMTASYPFTRLDSLIAGPPVLQRADWLARWREDRSAQGVPSMPTLLYHGRIDEVVPYSQGRQVFADWCARGAPVEFRTLEAADHFAGFALGAGPAMDWMSRRFGGAPVRSDCAPRSPEASPRAAPRMRLSVTPRRARSGRTTRYRFLVRSASSDCVRAVTIRFAGRRVRTDRRGRARLRVRVVRRGLRRAIATKRGCARARTAVRVR